MAFKVKDLLINIAPKEGEDVHYDAINTCGGTFFCPWSDTLHPTFWLLRWVCPPPTVIGPVGVAPGGDPAAAAKQFAVIKAQLRQALEEIENQEKAAGEDLQPRTVAEVELLEEKLNEALGELKQRKQKLQKKT
jgi:hypothetical protein